MLKVVILERKLWSETSIMVYLSLFSEVTNMIFQIFNTTYGDKFYYYIGLYYCLNPQPGETLGVQIEYIRI